MYVDNETGSLNMVKEYIKNELCKFSEEVSRTDIKKVAVGAIRNINILEKLNISESDYTSFFIDSENFIYDSINVLFEIVNRHNSINIIIALLLSIIQSEQE